MPPSALEPIVCPNCQEAELVQEAGSNWMQCPACGRYFDRDDLAEIYGPQVSDDAKLNSEIRAVFLESTRRREPGGGDDGLSMQPDIPVMDETIVSFLVHNLSKKKVMRVKNLKCTSKEAQEAILALIRERLLIEGIGLASLDSD